MLLKQDDVDPFTLIRTNWGNFLSRDSAIFPWTLYIELSAIINTVLVACGVRTKSKIHFNNQLLKELWYVSFRFVFIDTNCYVSTLLVTISTFARCSWMEVP